MPTCIRPVIRICIDIFCRYFTKKKVNGNVAFFSTYPLNILQIIYTGLVADTKPH